MNPGAFDIQAATGLPPLTLREHAAAREDLPAGHHIDVASSGLFAFSFLAPYTASYLTDKQVAIAARIAAAGPLLLWAVRDALNAIDVHARIDNPGEDSIAWEHHADHLKLAYRAATGEDWQ